RPGRAPHRARRPRSAPGYRPARSRARRRLGGLLEHLRVVPLDRRQELGPEARDLRGRQLAAPVAGAARREELLHLGRALAEALLALLLLERLEARGPDGASHLTVLHR